MDVVCRPATAADYEAVLALDPDRRIYGGGDYLPAMYRKFLQDPTKDVIVAVQRGEIVGCVVNARVDGGETHVTLAARTSATQRGTGIWTALKRVLTEKDLYSSVLKFRAGVTNGDWVRHRHELTSQGQLQVHNPAYLVDRRTLIAGFITRSSLLTHVPLQPVSCVRLLDKDALPRLFRDPVLSSRLFPAGRVICGPGEIVYRVHDSNIPAILNSIDSISGHFSAAGELAGVALAYHHEVPAGYQYRLQYYCQLPLQHRDVTSHVALHLKMAAGVATQKRVRFSLVLPACDSLERVVRDLSEITELTLQPGYSPRQCFVYELRKNTQSQL